jgi:hypothetical protein
MSSPAEVICQLLIDLNLATDVESSTSWPCYVSFLPDTPDEAICVYDTAGKLDGRIMSSGEQIEHPGIQIRIRGPAYIDLWNKVSDIADGLASQRRVSVAIDSAQVYFVHNISQTGAVIPMGIEEEGDRRRHHFVMNAVVTLEKE